MIITTSSPPDHSPSQVYTPQDYICNCIINQGEDPVIDTMIELLQKILKSKFIKGIYPSMAGEEGMQITRAAYAVMLKMSGMIR